MRVTFRFALFSVCASLLPLALPAPGRACFIVPTYKWDGYPADGATDVPLDVALIQWTRQGHNTISPALAPPGAAPVFELPEVTLTSESGDNVPLRRDRGQIIPQQPLAPRTRYTLLIKALKLNTPAPLPPFEGKDLTMSFTTGDSVYSGDIDAPIASVSSYEAHKITSCDPAERASCVSLEDDDYYAWRVEGQEIGGFTRGSFFVTNTRLPAFDCLELRRRAPNGQLGPAITICHDDGPSYNLDRVPSRATRASPLGCGPRGLTSDGELVSELEGALVQPEGEDPDDGESDGRGDENEEPTEEDVGPAEAPKPSKAKSKSCSVQSQSAGAGASWLVIAAAAMLGARRRRRDLA